MVTRTMCVFAVTISMVACGGTQPNPSSSISTVRDGKEASVVRDERGLRAVLTDLTTHKNVASLRWDEGAATTVTHVVTDAGQLLKGTLNHSFADATGSSLTESAAMVRSLWAASHAQGVRTPRHRIECVCDDGTDDCDECDPEDSPGDNGGGGGYTPQTCGYYSACEPGTNYDDMIGPPCPPAGAGMSWPPDTVCYSAFMYCVIIFPDCSSSSTTYPEPNDCHACY